MLSGLLPVPSVSLDTARGADVESLHGTEAGLVILMPRATKKLVREVVGGEPYDYYPLGNYIVVAPGVCGGRPTFKYTRIEVEVVLDLLATGEPLERLVENFRGRVSKEAIEETLRLAASLLKREAVAVAA